MTYEQRKEAARQEAIDWQQEISEQCPSYGELAKAMNHFEKTGRRYGLLTEFRANAIL